MFIFSDQGGREKSVKKIDVSKLQGNAYKYRKGNNLGKVNNIVNNGHLAGRKEWQI